MTLRKRKKEIDRQIDRARKRKRKKERNIAREEKKRGKKRKKREMSVNSEGERLFMTDGEQEMEEGETEFL